MANLTQYTGGSVSNSGVTIGTWVGLLSQYNAIKLVSDPDDMGNYDPTNVNFFPNYEHTLFHITDDTPEA